MCKNKINKTAFPVNLKQSYNSFEDNRVTQQFQTPIIIKSKKHILEFNIKFKYSHFQKVTVF